MEEEHEVFRGSVEMGAEAGEGGVNAEKMLTWQMVNIMFERSIVHDSRRAELPFLE